MNTREAAQAIDAKAARLLPAVPPDAPAAATQDFAETRCGAEPALEPDAGVTVSRDYIIRPTTPEIALRTMDALSTELQRQGLDRERDERDTRAPFVRFVDDDDFRTGVTVAIPRTRVTITISSPCANPI